MYPNMQELVVILYMVKCNLKAFSVKSVIMIMFVF